MATARVRCVSPIAVTSFSEGPGLDGRFIFKFAVTAATDSRVRGRTLPSARFDAVTLCRLSSWMGGAVGLLADALGDGDDLRRAQPGGFQFGDVRGRRAVRLPRQPVGIPQNGRLAR